MPKADKCNAQAHVCFGLRADKPFALCGSVPAFRRHLDLNLADRTSPTTDACSPFFIGAASRTKPFWVTV